MDKRLLELLVCPICKGPLRSVGAGSALESYAVRIGWPIRARRDSPDAAEEARTLNADDPLLESLASIDP